MNVLAVACSCLPRSNSLKVAKAFLRGAEEAGHNTELIKLNNNFHGCTGCSACKRGHCLCVQRDALSRYFELLPETDVLVLSAAIYMGYPQGEAWMFMNRNSCLDSGSGGACLIPVGKRLYYIQAQGAPDNPEYRGHADEMLKPFDLWGFIREDPMIVNWNNVDDACDRAFEIGRSL